MKKCTRCNRTLPLTDFRKKCSSTDGYTAACKYCLRESARLRHIRHETDDMRIQAFISVFRYSLRTTHDPHISLAKAIVYTSNDNYDKYAAVQPDLVKQWRREFKTERMEK